MKMRFFTFFVCVALSIPPSLQSKEGFCYKDSSCGPSSNKWDKLCQTGTRQSPINLPKGISSTGKVTLNLQAYKGDSFRVQNNGHTINLDFNGKGASTKPLKFPDPLDSKILREYKFAGAHFHWGSTDKSQGSEHCIDNHCGAMELHLVHHLSNSSGPGHALATKNENALTVIGVLLDVDKKSGGKLGPLVKKLKTVEHANHDSKKWTVVNEPLDLSQLLSSEEVYTYKGSLTTPGCNEQVNWFVLKSPSKVTSDESQAFRTLVKDDTDKVLTENWRPIQNTNDRQILLSKINK